MTSVNQFVTSNSLPNTSNSLLNTSNSLPNTSNSLLKSSQIEIFETNDHFSLICKFLHFCEICNVKLVKKSFNAAVTPKLMEFSLTSEFGKGWKEYFIDVNEFLIILEERRFLEFVKTE